MKKVTFLKAENMNTNVNLALKDGAPHPLGASFADDDSINFALYAPSAKGVSLHIFRSAWEEEPLIKWELDETLNKTGNIWHVRVSPSHLPLQDEKVRQSYDNLWDDVQEGMQHNRNCLYYLFAVSDAKGTAKYILEPYFKSITKEHIFKSEQLQADKLKETMSASNTMLPHKLTAKGFPKCVAQRNIPFDWEGDVRPRIPFSECIIYELHVKGMSAKADCISIPCKERGTYQALIHLIPYFKKLKVTTLELLPVFETDDEEIDRVSGDDGKPLTNYWGYSPLSFFAPKRSYACEKDNAICEFKTMVKAMHKEKIEVILDVVFNHTAEGGDEGRSFSFKAVAEDEYYFLDEYERHQNYSGCGNTFNASSDAGRKIIVDSLCYWVEQMHVDGFRFDLASILMREKKDASSPHPIINTQANILKDIALHPSLQDIKLIAEPWDALGGYNLGNFPIEWAEWNDRYRDMWRRFWLNPEGDAPSASQLLDSLSGSVSILSNRGSSRDSAYSSDGSASVDASSSVQSLSRSINFITCHDGFTMCDLVSYNYKHNEANGEGNRDGSSHNLSYNHGIEGESSNPKIIALRKRQIKNLFFSLILSNGIPMLLMGDEVMRSQKGNNNAYCQDNETSYFDWSLLEKNKDIFEYVSFLIEMRKKLKITNLFSLKSQESIICYNEIGGTQLLERKSKFAALLVPARNFHDYLFILNATSHDVTFRLPKTNTSKRWHLALDTSIESTEMELSTLSNFEIRNVYISVAHSATLLFA